MKPLSAEEIACILERIHLEIVASDELDAFVATMFRVGLLPMGHFQNYLGDINKFGVVSRAISCATLYLLNHAVELTTPESF